MKTLNSNCRILLGISGGIAAYKMPHLVRLLSKSGYQVRVCLSSNADKFVAPLSLQAVSGHQVYQHQFQPISDDGMEHISLVRWADCLLIAPASAGLIARLANGMADDLLSTMAIAASCLKILAPAMNQAMWANPIVQANLARLADCGWIVLPVDEGEQACGETGAGRMLEPEMLVDAISKHLVVGSSDNKNSSDTRESWWQGKHLLITAGPTFEAIDPVRFIGNKSSGKFGYAIASAASRLGARVSLISGPTSLPDPSGITTSRVTSAKQMLKAAQSVTGWDVCIGCAAVADYAPANPTDKKIHKSAKGYSLKLEANPDIIASMAQTRLDHQLVVGFCAETGDQQLLLERAHAKLVSKDVDLIVANRVGDNLVFDEDSASVWLVDKTGQRELARASKQRQAVAILQAISNFKRKL